MAATLDANDSQLLEFPRLKRIFTDPEINIPSTPPGTDVLTSPPPSTPRGNGAGNAQHTSEVDQTGSLKLHYTASDIHQLEETEQDYEKTQKDSPSLLYGYYGSPDKPSHGASYNGNGEVISVDEICSPCSERTAKDLDIEDDLLKDDSEGRQLFDESRRFGSPMFNKTNDGQSRTPPPNKIFHPLSGLTEMVPMSMTQLFNNTQGSSPFRPQAECSLTTFGGQCADSSSPVVTKVNDAKPTQQPPEMPYKSMQESQEDREKRQWSVSLKRLRSLSSDDDIGEDVAGGVVRVRQQRLRQQTRTNHSGSLFDNMREPRKTIDDIVEEQEQIKQKAQSQKNEKPTKLTKSGKPNPSKSQMASNEQAKRTKHRVDENLARKEHKSNFNARDRQKRKRTVSPEKSASGMSGDTTDDEDIRLPQLKPAMEMKASVAPVNVALLAEKTQEHDITEQSTQGSTTDDQIPEYVPNPLNWDLMHGIEVPRTSRRTRGRQNINEKRQIGATTLDNDSSIPHPSVAASQPIQSTVLSKGKSSIRNLPPFNIQFPMNKDQEKPASLRQGTSFTGLGLCKINTFYERSSSIPLPPRMDLDTPLSSPPGAVLDEFPMTQVLQSSSPPVIPTSPTNYEKSESGKHLAECTTPPNKAGNLTEFTTVIPSTSPCDGRKPLASQEQTPQPSTFSTERVLNPTPQSHYEINHSLTDVDGTPLSSRSGTPHEQSKQRGTQIPTSGETAVPCSLENEQIRGNITMNTPQQCNTALSDTSAIERQAPFLDLSPSKKRKTTISSTNTAPPTVREKNKENMDSKMNDTKQFVFSEKAQSQSPPENSSSFKENENRSLSTPTTAVKSSATKSKRRTKKSAALSRRTRSAQFSIEPSLSTPTAIFHAHNEQGGSVAVSIADESNITETDEPDASNDAKYRVFALFKDKQMYYHPATVKPSTNIAQSNLRVVFVDGTEDVIDRSHVRRLDLRIGDVIKVDLPNMKKGLWVVSGFASERLAFREGSLESAMVDIRGNASVFVKAKKKGVSLSGNGETSGLETTANDANAVGTAVEVPLTRIYLPKSLWKQFHSRVYIDLPPLRYGNVLDKTSPPLANQGQQRMMQSTILSNSNRCGTQTMQHQTNYNASAAIFATSNSANIGNNNQNLCYGLMSNNGGGKLFTGMVFALTFGDKESLKKSITSKILSNGGRIAENGFVELFCPLPSNSNCSSESLTSEEVTDALRPLETQAVQQITFACVLADTYCRRVKFLQGLALGLPCLSQKWVEDCLKRNSIVDWELYLLPAGECSYLGGAIRSRTNLPYTPASSSRFTQTIANRTKILEGLTVLVVTGPQGTNGGGIAEKRKPYIFLAYALGPKRLFRVASVEQANKVLLEGKVRVDVVYADGSILRASGGVGNLWKGLRRGAPMMLRLVDDEWVVQSLILGGKGGVPGDDWG